MDYYSLSLARNNALLKGNVKAAGFPCFVIKDNSMGSFLSYKL